jgi:muramoyltetrapeptide carboxypeptidase
VLRHKKPHALYEGATVGVICVAAPEGKHFEDRLRQGIARMEEMGFEVELAPHVLAQSGYASAPPDIVAGEIMDMFRNPRVDALICAGGGNTSSRVLPYLDFALIAANPKVVVGASDPTSLLNVISQYAELITFHGPSVIWDFGDPEQPSDTVSSFLAVVRDGERELAPLATWLRRGKARGRLLGGNLTALTHLVGTRFEPHWTDAILIWEDVGEDTAHLVAKLTQLEQAGVFDEIAGMIVGRLTDCAPSEGVEPVEAIEQLLRHYSFPIALDLPFGHTSLKYTLPIGSWVSMSADSDSLHATEPAVIAPLAPRQTVA